MQQKTHSRKPFFSGHSTWRRITALMLILGMTAAICTVPAMAQVPAAQGSGAASLPSADAIGTKPILEKLGTQLGISGTYTSLWEDGDPLDVLIGRADWQVVRVICDGTVRSVRTLGETVYDVLEKLHITIGQDDLVSCSLDTRTYTGLTVRVTRVTYGSDEYQAALPAEDTVYYNSVMSPSQETVLQEGSDGVVRRAEKITYFDGREVSREVTKETVVTPAVNRVVIRGAEKASMPVASGKNTLTTSGGETLSYSKVIDGVATAYNCPGYVGHTASGTIAQVGKVAVDPRVIPLGTKLYIVSQDGQYVYGYCIAEDTGGLIKGNKVDLYFSTWDECIQFGYRPITIYVVR